MLLFLVFLFLTAFAKINAEEVGGKRGIKENFFLFLTYAFGVITIYLAVSYFLYDSSQPVSPYDFHW